MPKGRMMTPKRQPRRREWWATKIIKSNATRKLRKGYITYRPRSASSLLILLRAMSGNM